MTYQLPTDADGVKYHGREYDDKGGIIAAGVDEHGNDKPILINTDGSLNMQSVVQELHDIKQRQQEILERLDDPINTRVTGSIVEDESLAIRGRRVETYASDSGSFSIEVLPGSTYYADVLFKNGRIVGFLGGDMRNYRKIVVGVQRGTGKHDYRLEVRARATGTHTSINQLEVVGGSDQVKVIDIELLFHLVSVRIHNDSDEVQNYQLAVSAFPI